MREKKKMSMKIVVLLMAFVLMIGCIAGGTLAYLMTKTNEVTNTFVAGNIGKLELDETKGNSFVVVPGANITKDPIVKFTEYNVDSYVFLKIDATGWNVTSTDNNHVYSIGVDTTEGEVTLEKEMKWTLEGWTKLEEENGVYFKTVKVAPSAQTQSQTWTIIKENTITVESGITQAEISNYAKNLTFTAYAIQQEGHVGTTEAEKAAAAWAAIDTSN